MAESNNAAPREQAAAEAGVMFYTQPRKILFHRLTAHEIQALYEAGNYKTLDISMFAMCGGVFVTLLVTLATITFDSPFLLAGFVAAGCVFGVGTIVFGIRARIAWKSAKRELDALRAQSAGA
jgi:hypothetical protein